MKKFILYFSAVQLLLCSSCANDDIVLPVEVAGNSSEASVAIKGISPEVIELQSSDAEIVANLYMGGNMTSRSQTAEVKNVVVIPDAAGEAALYAVNYEDGYVLVSATKNLPPILAVVGHGNYSLNDDPTGRDILVSQMVAESEYWRNNGGNTCFKQEWRHYTHYPSDITETLSRAHDDTDPWYVLSEKMYELETDGYDCYRITRFEEDQDIMPNWILEKFKHSARFEDNIWEDEYGDEFMYETAFIAIKTASSNGGSPQVPYMTTKWGQQGYYNALLDNGNPLGCVTIAVGQIMKYHQYPTYFSWSMMPDKLDNYDYGGYLISFLKTIHDNLGVSNSGGATIDDAKRVLESYGYTVQKRNHQNGVYSYPTYCRGNNTTGIKRHAWVCDGESRSGYWRVDYELYVFDNAYYPKFRYTKLDSEIDQSTGNVLYHMNWGWYGDYNGFFYEGSMSLNGTDLNTQRQDLFITKP